MTFTLTLAWWWIPAAITAVSVIWALFIFRDSDGYLSGIGNLFMLVPALAISLVAWIIAAVLK